jgi:hypothetical protein
VAKRVVITPGLDLSTIAAAQFDRKIPGYSGGSAPDSHRLPFVAPTGAPRRKPGTGMRGSATAFLLLAVSRRRQS